MALCFLTSNLLIGETTQPLPFFIERFTTTIEKCHHKWPRGHRGHRGHRGPSGASGASGYPGDTGLQGLPGDPGSTQVRGYISLSFVESPLNIYPTAGTPTIIPFGVNGTIPYPPVLFEYIDPDPTDLTADRYIHVLPGGGGIYYIEFTIYAYAYDEGQTLLPALLQPQIDIGYGWDETLPYNAVQTTLVPADQPYFVSEGTGEAIVPLLDGSKFRVKLLQATEGLTIGSTSHIALRSRDVSISIHRIDVLPE